MKYYSNIVLFSITFSFGPLAYLIELLFRSQAHLERSTDFRMSFEIFLELQFARRAVDQLYRQRNPIRRCPPDALFARYQSANGLQR